jgi:hypothetical protein
VSWRNQRQRDLAGNSVQGNFEKRLKGFVLSFSYSLSVILQPTVRVRSWSAGIGMASGATGHGWLCWLENQQVNRPRPLRGDVS